MDPEKYLDYCIQENTELGFQLDALSDQISKEIEKKTKTNLIEQENDKILEELFKVNLEIESYETQKKKNHDKNFSEQQLEEQIHLLKIQIKYFRNQNKKLQSTQSTSELFQQLTSLRTQEESLLSALKTDKQEIQNYKKTLKSDNPIPESDLQDPSIFDQIQKNKELKSENFRSKRAWELILSEMFSKKQELEEEVYQLQKELKLRSRSCRIKKLFRNKHRNSP